MSFLENKNHKKEQQIDIHEQYSRGNCLLIHGIKEIRHKATDELVIQTIKSKMDIGVDVKYINQTY